MQGGHINRHLCLAIPLPLWRGHCVCLLVASIRFRVFQCGPEQLNSGFRVLLQPPHAPPTPMKILPTSPVPAAGQGRCWQSKGEEVEKKEEKRCSYSVMLWCCGVYYF